MSPDPIVVAINSRGSPVDPHMSTGLFVVADHSAVTRVFSSGTSGQRLPKGRARPSSRRTARLAVDLSTWREECMGAGRGQLDDVHAPQATLVAISTEEPPPCVPLGLLGRDTRGLTRAHADWTEGRAGPPVDTQQARRKVANRRGQPRSGTGSVYSPLPGHRKVGERGNRCNRLFAATQ